MFPECDILMVYTPNNGQKRESNQRRREWDEHMLDFLKGRQKILQSAKEEERRLIFCGDLNCALEYCDGTHWVRQANGSVMEWWTNERKSIASLDKCDPDREPGDIGIASFTSNERSRLRNIIAEVDLVDVWRMLHPHNEKEGRNWELPLWTWRGHLSTSSVPSRYEGKGQRIDYFLISPSHNVSSIVEECEILGEGTKRRGLFCGSDHCATILRLRSKDAQLKK